MVNSILDAVTRQLGTTFGKDYHYYKENVEQKLVEPCFTVDALLPTFRSISPILYDRTFPIVLHYFSDGKEKKTDCYNMSERVIECLEYLPFKDTIVRGEDISWQIVDDVLQIFVTYQLVTRRDVDDGESMETLIEAVTHSE